MKSACGELSQEVGQIYSTLTMMRVHEERPGDAYNMGKKAMDALCSSLGSHHPQVASLLHTMSLLCEQVGWIKESEAILQWALSICPNSSPKEVPPDVLHTKSACLHNLGRTYQETGKLKEAVSMFEAALRIDEHLYGIKSEYLLELLRRLGCMYYILGEEEKAVEMYNRACSISSRFIGEGEEDEEPDFIPQPMEDHASKEEQERASWDANDTQRLFRGWSFTREDSPTEFMGTEDEGQDEECTEKTPLLMNEKQDSEPPEESRKESKVRVRRDALGHGHIVKKEQVPYEEVSESTPLLPPTEKEEEVTETESELATETTPLLEKEVEYDKKTKSVMCTRSEIPAGTSIDEWTEGSDNDIDAIELIDDYFSWV